MSGGSRSAAEIEGRMSGGGQQARFRREESMGIWMYQPYSDVFTN